MKIIAILVLAGCNGGQFLTPSGHTIEKWCDADAGVCCYIHVCADGDISCVKVK